MNCEFGHYECLFTLIDLEIPRAWWCNLCKNCYRNFDDYLKHTNGEEK